MCTLPNESRALPVSLNLPGVHNVRNALGAIAIAWELGVDIASVIEILAGLEGIDRRFAEVGRFEVGTGGVMVIEDYGHHPSELTATIAAARSGWPDKRIVTVFQPHRLQPHTCPVRRVFPGPGRLRCGGADRYISGG